MIVAATKPGDVVLDPFFGSGTTGAVAKRLGRHWIGLERDKGYIKLALDRIAKVQRAETEMLTIQAKRDEPRIPFGWLVERGLLQPGAVLESFNRRWTAKVRSDGTLISSEHRGSIHQVGAAVQGRPPATAGSSGACPRTASWCRSIITASCSGRNCTELISDERDHLALRGMTVPNLPENTPTITASEPLPALPPKRARRRSTRASHSWCFRKPPSRKRVEIATARGLPDPTQAPAPMPDRQPINDSSN